MFHTSEMHERVFLKLINTRDLPIDGTTTRKSKQKKKLDGEE